MYVIAAFYQFTRITDPEALKKPLAACACAGEVTGTILIAPEGINGTIAGPRSGIDRVMAHIRTLPDCAEIEWKESHAEQPPFGRLKVRLKQEIVTMRQPGVDPTCAVGRYVAAQDWNALISAPDVAVIDTRNDFEVAIGTFRGAINPATTSFSDFPAWWEANRAGLEGKRIAMFCTGGIRCEKSTNWLISQGVEEVFHLKGGILKYLEDVPEDESLWEGACFVFDRRVSVRHGLKEGEHALCHGCRRPLSPEDLERPEYEPGVSCHQCLNEHTEEDRARFRERHRQMALTAAREG